MKRWILTLLLLTVAAPTLGACGNSCEELADLTCKRAGEESETCKTIRARAEKANSDQRRACEMALGVVDDFSSPQ